MNTVMNAKDAIYGSLAECFITIENNRYNFMQLYEFESKYEVNLVEVPILGRTTKGNKAAGGKGTWNGTAHYNQSIFRKLLYKYKQTGAMPVFDIQVTNEDPTSSAGRQTIILKDCVLEGGILAKYSAGDDILDEEISGTFDDWEIPETFNSLDGM